MLSRTRHPWAARYGAAALAVTIAFLLTALLDPLLQEASPFLLLSAAVLAAAAYGGLGPGVLATLLGAVVGDYLFLPPLGTLAPPSAAHGLTTGLFIVQGLVISAIGAWLASSRRRAEESALRATEDRRSLSESEERYRLLVEGAKDFAIFMVDTEGRVRDWNEGARRVFGYEEGEIVGEDGSVLFTPEDRESGAPERELGKARTEGRAEDERWHVRKDGSYFWASGYVRPLRDEDGNLRGFSKVARDITERK
ncbi:MAG TPA: PAS domain S-box protein, partial [Rubrobacter sp.]|nr:PAS domain S-box protein [Rubrobacter sp.]